MITVDQIMSAPGGPPCSKWTRERVAQAMRVLDCRSWTAAAESARAGGWRAVSLADLRLTAYRVATTAQRIVGMRRSIQIRIEAQHARWPDADDHTLGVRGELLRWCAGDDAIDLRSLRDAADVAYTYAAADESFAGLAFICAVLDGEAGK